MKKLALGMVLLCLGVCAISTATADQLFLPFISVEPDAYDFGPVPLNAIATAALIVTNSGDGPLTVSAVKTKAPFDDGVTAPFTIPPHSSRRVMISFRPTATGFFSGPCTFVSNAANAPTLTIPLSGEGVEE